MTVSENTDSAAVEMNPKIGAFKAFLTVWLGQSISTIGSQMTGFALSIWIFNESQSVIAFGIVVAAQLGPALLFSPFAGVLIDRQSRKRVMMLCDFGMLLVCLTLLFLAYIDALNIMRVIYLTPLLALMGMFHSIAYSSSISHLVPKELYGKANAMIHVAINLSAVVVPIVAVLVLEYAGIVRVLAVNAVSYVVAIISLAMVHFPFANKQKKSKSNLFQLLQEQKFGFTYLLNSDNRFLARLLLLLGIVMMLNGAVQVLFRPMILESHSEEVVGWLVSIAGAGGLAGAIFSGVFVHEKNRMQTLRRFAYLGGLASIACGFISNNYLMAVIVFLFSFSLPIVTVASQTFWQLIVPKDIQGKVFAVRTFVVSVVMALTVLIVPFISEYIMQPLFVGELHIYLNGYVNDGIGLTFIFMGLVSVLGVLAASSGKRFNRLVNEVDLPQSES